MALAVYGKHPAKGDFLEHGLPAALKAPLEGWLDAVLGEARADLGPTWEQVWRDAPLLRFWVGEGVWGQPVAGVMAASQDRVGRRFPLVMLCAGADAARLPAPTIGDDGGWYDAMAGHLATWLATRDLAVPADLLTGAAVPVELGTPEPGPDSFWAVRPGASVAALLTDIALTDHRRAAAGRSYWWVAGQDAIAPEDAAEPEPAVEPEDAVDEVEAAGAAAEVPEDVVAKEDGSSADTPDEIPVETAEAAPVTADADAWDLPELPMDDDSPFASAGGPSLFAAPLAGGPSRFAAPLAAGPAFRVAEPAPFAPTTPPVARVLCSQVWAGSGLPSGQVLAWFLRGVTENG